MADDLLETVVRRKSALAALAAEPQHRRELQECLGVSKTTCHRIVRTFKNEGLIRQTNSGYELTPVGQVIESQVEAFQQGIRTATELEPLLAAVESAEISFDIDLFTDARITRPTPEEPSGPVDRFLELFRDCETVRTVDCTSFVPPLYIQEMFETGLVDDRMGVAVLPESVVETRFAEYPDIHRRIAEEDALIRYRIHDEVPFGLTVYDTDHVGLRAYDDETGVPLLFADTDNPEAVAWATDVFEQYYNQSEPAAAVDSLPDWLPESQLSF